MWTVTVAYDDDDQVVQGYLDNLKVETPRSDKIEICQGGKGY